MSELLTIAKGTEEIAILPKMANRHGLIAGATGTGKTVTLRVLAEEFSRAGVPVFMADVKGDLSGIAEAGGEHPKVQERVATLQLDDYSPEGFPTVLWDLYGEQGHPVRTTVSEMGPLLFARLFNLNDTQSGVLSLVFKIADDQGLLLLDLKDFQEMVRYVGDNAAEFRTSYGNISAASIGAIQRSLMTLEEAGGDRFFGEPALDLEDLIQCDGDGRGVINILSASRLMQSPKLYATFLLWLLAELFERLPEVGDPEKPKLVFFFDEAHLLFDNPPQALLDKIEQVVRLIRSKGVGVYFVTQNPLDIPEAILGQLGNRVQHALRAFTPKDQRAVRAAAETFRARPGLDVATAIMELETGEALVSILDRKGAPTPVERALIFPPRSRLPPLTPAEMATIIRTSPLAGHYEKSVDRESAYEKLKARAEAESAAVTPEPRGRKAAPAVPGGDLLAAAAKSAAHAIGSSLGRQIIRGVLGSLFGGGKKR
ncbi:MAG: helicase HerA-like domain-containing protein [Desulfuromonadales bacterium]|nr:helicase HerA-like domain-containing protein [Desulfuromonadales bacterium]